MSQIGRFVEAIIAGAPRITPHEARMAAINVQKVIEWESRTVPPTSPHLRLGNDALSHQAKADVRPVPKTAKAKKNR